MILPDVCSKPGGSVHGASVGEDYWFDTEWFRLGTLWLQKDRACCHDGSYFDLPLSDRLEASCWPMCLRINAHLVLSVIVMVLK